MEAFNVQGKFDKNSLSSLILPMTTALTFVKERYDFVSLAYTYICAQEKVLMFNIFYIT